MADVKMVLEETDYLQYIQNEPSPITIQTLKNKMRQKLADEFMFFKLNSAPPLL